MHCSLFVFVELHFIIVEKSLKKFRKYWDNINLLQLKHWHSLMINL